MSFTRPQNARSSQPPSLPTGTQIAVYATYAEAQQAVHYLAAEHFPVEQLTIFGTDLHSVERVTGRLSYGRVAIAGAMSGGWFGLFVGLLLSLFGGAGFTSGFTAISVALGAGFGLLFSVLSYAVTRSRRDFTSSSQIVAGQYAVLCKPEQAVTAQQLLQRSAVGIQTKGSGLPVGGFAPVGGAGIGTPIGIPGSGNLGGNQGGKQSSGVQPILPSASSQTVAPAPVPGVVVTGGGAQQVGQPAQSATPPWKPDSRWLDENGRPKFGAMVDDQPVSASSAIVEQGIAPAEPATDHALATQSSEGTSPPPPTPVDPFAPPPGTYKK